MELVRERQFEKGANMAETREHEKPMQPKPGQHQPGQQQPGQHQPGQQQPGQRPQHEQEKEKVGRMSDKGQRERDDQESGQPVQLDK